jgi:hypothetical protein
VWRGHTCCFEEFDILCTTLIRDLIRSKQVVFAAAGGLSFFSHRVYQSARQIVALRVPDPESDIIHADDLQGALSKAKTAKQSLRCTENKATKEEHM